MNQPIVENEELLAAFLSNPPDAIAPAVPEALGKANGMDDTEGRSP